jgi:3-deoxy-manno-octulosonate cytidylyltransferase (CMP-KDO synthetase)
MDTIVFIPARLDSRRLNNKPLADISGKPMIIHVAERAASANVGDIYIACCGEEIANVARQHGHKAIVTPPELPSGTDRVYHALQNIMKNKTDSTIKYIINVQGDMPFINPDIIISTLKTLQQNEDADIATPITTLSDSEISDKNVVKAVVSEKNKRLLYFSRAPVANAYKHIGIYAFKIKSLKLFVNLPPSKLESAEKLEQLRALEHGMHITSTIVDTDVISVDTEGDLIRARNTL